MSIGDQIAVAETEASGKTIGSLLLMDHRTRDREGREMLSVEDLPLGNYYCMMCTHPGFVVPENGTVVGVMPIFCDNCDLLFAEGVL